MSDTIVDMPKVAQMLDAGWRISLVKNGLGSYSARGKHNNREVMKRTRNKLVEFMRSCPESLEMLKQTAEESADEEFDDGWLITAPIYLTHQEIDS